MKIKVPRRPLFRWLTSGVEPGSWVLALGPAVRYVMGGVLSHRDQLALMLGDAPTLSTSGLQWRDPLQRTWRGDWPLWLWPDDARVVGDLTLELAQSNRVAPRLASNARAWRREWAARRAEAMRPVARQLTLVLGVGLRRRT